MTYAINARTALQWGLRESALLGGLLGGIIISQGFARASTWVSTSRRHGLFVRSRGPLRSRCPRCGGFRIQRCPLCDGSGLCICTRRYRRAIPCPMCMRRRFVECEMCHASGRRPVVRSVAPLVRRVSFANRLRGIVERALFWVSSLAARTLDSSQDLNVIAFGVNSSSHFQRCNQQQQFDAKFIVSPSYAM